MSVHLPGFREVSLHSAEELLTTKRNKRPYTIRKSKILSKNSVYFAMT